MSPTPGPGGCSTPHPSVLVAFPCLLPTAAMGSLCSEPSKNLTLVCCRLTAFCSSLQVHESPCPLQPQVPADGVRARSQLCHPRRESLSLSPSPCEGQHSTLWGHLGHPKGYLKMPVFSPAPPEIPGGGMSSWAWCSRDALLPPLAITGSWCVMVLWDDP